MRVYNLTSDPIIYRRRTIPGCGGYLDFTDLTFIPNRDLDLEKNKVLAFGALPAWWLAQQVKPAPIPKPVKVLPQPKKVEVAVKEEVVTPVAVDDSTEVKVFKKKS